MLKYPRHDEYHKHKHNPFRFLLEIRKSMYLVPWDGRMRKEERLLRISST